MSREFYPGQRWLSEAEPEMGLGTVIAVDQRTVNVVFLAVDESRQYSVETAPLNRVSFRAGDKIELTTGEAGTVVSVRNENNLFYYNLGEREVCETELSERLSSDEAQQRLVQGQLDHHSGFDLRYSAIRHFSEYHQSPVFGLSGARIDLIPHQLYIADEVTSRPIPRVLLADEVGLGKTIEAGLIVHRLLMSGRAKRVLVLLPDSLVHQWFVEFYRRFNLWGHIFDREKYSHFDGSVDNNPFNDHQLVLAPVDFLVNSPWGALAKKTDWDVVVVDEAHHLEWNDEFSSPEYDFVETLARISAGLLLLTATPEQLGPVSHFARLRLLDPDRYYSLENFLEQSAHFQETAQKACEMIEQGVSEAELEKVLDEYGPGRVMFRNTRVHMQGFPQRKLRLHALNDAQADRDALLKEFLSDAGKLDYKAALTAADPRVKWLASLLSDQSVGKVLIICRTRLKAESLQNALSEHLNVKSTLFHEGLSLLQRDRNAAYFAEEEGARVLICSEIGSEGRNFQFAHHLVLFDLPVDPELLEQRIGRLDRIGQTEEINLHVPVVGESPQEALAKWFHQGLNAFEKNFEFGNRFKEDLEDLVNFCSVESDRDALDTLIAETVEKRKVLQQELEAGRDKLLELNSHRPSRSSKIVNELKSLDESHLLESFFFELLDFFGVYYEEVGHRTFKVGGSGQALVDIPALPDHGVVGTFERKKALSREDLTFFTWDHPLISGMFDVLFGMSFGNSSYGEWIDDGGRELILEAMFVVECAAPAYLQINRFLADRAIYVACDHALQDVTTKYSHKLISENLTSGNADRLLSSEKITQQVLPQLFGKCHELAEAKLPGIKEMALDRAVTLLGAEVDRLCRLAEKNPNVQQSEIDHMVKRKEETLGSLAKLQIRLDSLRLVWKGDRLV